KAGQRSREGHFARGGLFLSKLPTPASHRLGQDTAPLRVPAWCSCWRCLLQSPLFQKGQLLNLGKGHQGPRLSRKIPRLSWPNPRSSPDFLIKRDCFLFSLDDYFYL